MVQLHLLPDVVPVKFNGPDGQVKHLRYFLVRPPLLDEIGNLDFPARQVEVGQGDIPEER